MTSRASYFFQIRPRPALRAIHSQSGMLLVEAMCAILIFSFGVLGLIGLQATSVSQSTDAKYRSAAAELADQLINQMWVSNRSAGTVTTAFEPLFVSSGTVYTAWLGNTSTPGTVMGTLPGVTATANLPTVSFGSPLSPTGCSTTAPVTCTVTATVTVNWQGPKDVAAHSYVVNAQFNLY